MSTPKNIQLPYDVFLALMDTIEYIDIQNYDENFQKQFSAILDILKDKKKSIEIRNAYSGILTAKNEEERHNAKINYLQKKNDFNN